MTPQEYEVFLLRSKASRPHGETGSILRGGSEETPEREIHEQISSWLKERGILFFHGSMAHRTHRTIGEPDYTIVLQGRVVFVEVKRSAKHKPSVEQRDTIAWLRKLGHKAEIVTSLSEVITLCQTVPPP